jgi:hypothetical protein
VREDLLDRDELLEAELTLELRLEQLGHAPHRDAIEDLISPDLLGERHEILIIQSADGSGASLAARILPRPPHLAITDDNATSVREVAQWHSGC